MDELIKILVLKEQKSPVFDKNYCVYLSKIKTLGQNNTSHLLCQVLKY